MKKAQTFFSAEKKVITHNDHQSNHVSREYALFSRETNYIVKLTSQKRKIHINRPVDDDNFIRHRHHEHRGLIKATIRKKTVAIRQKSVILGHPVRIYGVFRHA